MTARRTSGAPRRFLGILTVKGYELLERGEEADVILLNTCSVRAHAEERAFGHLVGELRRLRLGQHVDAERAWAIGQS
jgi:tRNA A37 methylthiotransferase MiaB